MVGFTLDTILLPEDISRQAKLHCLACKRRLGWMKYAGEGAKAGTRKLTVTMSLYSDLVHDYRQGEECVVLVCQCGQASTYHLL